MPLPPKERLLNNIYQLDLYFTLTSSKVNALNANGKNENSSGL